MDNADYEEQEVSERLKSLWGLSADWVVEYFSSDIYISAENHGRLKAHKRQHCYAELSSLALFVSTWTSLVFFFKDLLL